MPERSSPPSETEVVASSASEGFRGPGAQIKGLENLEGLKLETKDLNDEQLLQLVRDFEEIRTQHETEDAQETALIGLAAQKFGIISSEQVQEVTRNFVERHGLPEITINDTERHAAFKSFKAAEDSPYRAHAQTLYDLHVALHDLEEGIKVHGAEQPVTPDQRSPEEQEEIVDPAEVHHPPEQESILAEDAPEDIPNVELADSEYNFHTHDGQVEYVQDRGLRRWALDGLKEIGEIHGSVEAGEFLNLLQAEYARRTGEIRTEDGLDDELEMVKRLLIISEGSDDSDYPDPEEWFTDPPDVPEQVPADEALRNLAEARAKARSAAVKVEVKQEAAEKAGREWLEAVTEQSREQLEALEDRSEQAILDMVREILAREEAERSDAEIKARANDNSLKGRFVKAWRSSKGVKIRIGAGIVLTAATGGLGALGVAGVASGSLAAIPAAARGILSGLNAYMGVKAAQEKGESWSSHKFGKNSKVDSAESFMMGEEKRREAAARFFSPATQAARSEKHAEQDKASLEEIRVAERARIERIFNENDDPDLIERALSILTATRQEQLKAENARLEQDRKVNNRRRFVAASFGAFAASTAFIGGLERAGGVSGSDAPGTEAPEAPENPDSEGTIPPTDGAGGGREYAESRYIVDEVQSGETIWNMSGDHARLEYNREFGKGAWEKLDTHQQTEITDAVKDQIVGKGEGLPGPNSNLIHPGEEVRIDRDAMKKIVKRYGARFEE